MDRGRSMSPAEYEQYFQDEIERDRQSNERWEQMKQDPALKTYFQIWDYLIEIINQATEERANDNLYD